MSVIVTTISGKQHRLQYLRESLTALTRTIGVEDSTIIFTVEPNYAKDECINIIADCKSFFKCVKVIINDEVKGIAENTFLALSKGFELADRVICIEEDVLVSKDCLVFFNTMLDKFDDDKLICAINGSALNGRQIKPGAANKIAIRKQFAPLGWAIWRDRWEEVKRTFCTDYRGWDFSFQTWRRNNDLKVVFPLLSRCLHIGTHGEHNKPGKVSEMIYRETEFFDINANEKVWI